MARITWLPRENSGPNSAISASIFNEISSSIDFLYNQLDPLIALEGAGSDQRNARGGSTNYITPVAIYNPDDQTQVLDLSRGIFDFQGKDVEIRNDLYVRGYITASGLQTNVLAIRSGSNDPENRTKHPVLKVGSDSSYVTENFIATPKFTSPNSSNADIEDWGQGIFDGESAINAGYTADVTEGKTKIKLHADNDGEAGDNPNQDNKIVFTLNSNDVYIFDPSYTEIATPGQTSNPGVGLLTIKDGVTLGDSKRIEYITVDDLDSLIGGGGGGNTIAFKSASIVGGGDIITASVIESLRFSPYGGLYMDIINESTLDLLPIITVGTSSLFTASWAHNAITSSYALTASFVESSSYSLSSSFAVSASYAPPTPTPNWNAVLGVGNDANTNLFVNGNNKLIFGTTADENIDVSSIYWDGDDLEITSQADIFLNPNNNIGAGTAEPTEKLDVDGNLRVRGTISASDLPVVSGENTLVLWDGHKLVSNEFSTVLDANTANSFATASFGNAGEVIATSDTSSFQFGFENGLSGSIQSNILTIGTSSAFSASYALTAISASYIAADDIDQPFSTLEVTGNITASIISASLNITASDFYLDDWGGLSASLAAAVDSNDNLGNHTAEEDLDMATFNIKGVTNITASNEISASGGFIGDLTGTASFATSASYVNTAETASFVTGSNVYGPHGANSVISASYSISSSHSELADNATNATTASHALNANTSITASHVADALYSASINDATITYHQFDGDTLVHTVDNVVSASLAQTASYVENAQTASYVENAQTASYVENAQTASYVETAQTASYVVTAISSSHTADAFTTATGNNTNTITLTQFDGDQTAITVDNVTTATSASLAQTASYVENAQTASYVEQAVSASFATTASYFDIEFGSTVQGTLTASINGTEEYIDLGVQSSDNVVFANLTATGNVIKLEGIPSSSAITTPLVIDAQGCIYTGSAYTAYTPSGDFNGFYAGADSGDNQAIDAADTLEIIGDVDTPGISTTINGAGGGGQIKISLSNILSSSQQIATDISGAIDAATSSLASDIITLETSASAGIHFKEFGTTDGFSISQFETGTFDASGGDGLVVEITGQNILYKLVGVLSSSQQISTDISGAIDAATGSVLSDYGLLSSSAQIADAISGSFTSTSASLSSSVAELQVASSSIAVEINDLQSASSSFATDINNLESASSSFAGDIIELEASASAGIFFNNSDDPGFSIPLTGTASFIAAGNAYENGFFDVTVVNSAVSYSLDLPSNLVSSSQQIATDVSGAITAATSSILNDYGLLSGSVDVNQNAFSTASIFGTDLEIVSANTIDNLEFEAGPNIFLTTGSTGTIYISASSNGGADNLGDHTATQNLIMGNGLTNYSINNVDDITVYGDIRLKGLNKISFDNDNSNTYIAANNDNPEDIEIHADGDILLKPDNNVGIGIASTSPSEKLEVGGTVKAQHFISTGGSGATPSFSFSNETDTGLYRPAPGNISLQVDGGAVEFTLRTADANLNVPLTVRGNITASALLGDEGNISASGYLQSSVTDKEDYSSNVSNHVVLYDTSSGRFFYTGSYGVGTTSTTGTGDANVLTLNNNTSNVANIGTAALNSSHTYLRAEFYAKSGSIIQAARSVFVFESPGRDLTVTTVEDIRTHDHINLFDINSVSGSWDSNDNLRIKLNQYNGLNVDYKLRYILI